MAGFSDGPYFGHKRVEWGEMCTKVVTIGLAVAFGYLKVNYSAIILAFFLYTPGPFAALLWCRAIVWYRSLT